MEKWTTGKGKSRFHLLQHTQPRCQTQYLHFSQTGQGFQEEKSPGNPHCSRGMWSGVCPAAFSQTGSFTPQFPGTAPVLVEPATPRLALGEVWTSQTRKCSSPPSPEHSRSRVCRTNSIRACRVSQSIFTKISDFKNSLKRARPSSPLHLLFISSSSPSAGAQLPWGQLRIIWWHLQQLLTRNKIPWDDPQS